MTRRPRRNEQSSPRNRATPEARSAVPLRDNDVSQETVSVPAGQHDPYPLTSQDRADFVDYFLTALRGDPSAPVFRSTLAGGTAGDRQHVLEQVLNRVTADGNWMVQDAVLAPTGNPNGEVTLHLVPRKPVPPQATRQVLIVEDAHLFPVGVLDHVRLGLFNAEGSPIAELLRCHNRPTDIGMVATCAPHHTEHLKMLSRCGVVFSRK